MEMQVKTNNRLIAKNAMYMYIRMLVMLLVSLYTTRVVLATLGIDDYGIYNVVGGIVVFFSFINAGLAGATKRFILAELAVGTIESQRKVYSLAINAHLLIVSIVFFAGETIGLWILNNLMNIPVERMFAANVVYQASLFTAITSILQSPFSSVVISFERMSVYAYLSIFDVLLKLGIVFLIQIVEGDRLIYYAILLCLIALFDIIFYFAYCRKKFTMCRYVKARDKDTFYSILQYVGWTVFGSGSNVISRQGVSILINNFFSVAVNAAMGISNMIVNVASQFVSNLQVAFAPQLTKNYISEDYSTLMDLVSRSSRYTSYLILVILVPICFVISDLLEIWLGVYPEYTEEFCILTLFCVYIEAVSMPLTTVITAEKNIKSYQIIVSVFNLANFFACWIVLCTNVQPFAVMIVRAGIDIGLVWVRFNFMKRKVQTFSVVSWCINAYGKSLLMAFLSLPLMILFQKTHIEQTFSHLIVFGGISLIWIGCLICVLGFTKEEKRFILNFRRKNEII